MSLELLSKLNEYVGDLFAPPDPILEAVLEESNKAGLPEIHISPAQGKLLQLFVQITGAKRVLEVGTLGGYSTIWLGRGLPADGTLVSLELNEHYAEVARKNIARASLEETVEVQVGDAREILAEMSRSESGSCDLTFIDADKKNYLDYLDWVVRLSSSGAVILADNVIWNGSVLNPQDEESRALRQFNEQLTRDSRLSAVVLPIFREGVAKLPSGIDGLAVAHVVRR